MKLASALLHLSPKNIFSSFWSTSPLPFTPCREPPDGYLLPNSKSGPRNSSIREDKDLRGDFKDGWPERFLIPWEEGVSFFSFSKETFFLLPPRLNLPLQTLSKDVMIYQLLSNLELLVSWGQRPSAQYDNKVLHLTAKSLDTAAFQHSRLENVLQLYRSGRRGRRRGKEKENKGKKIKEKEHNEWIKYGHE